MNVARGKNYRKVTYSQRHWKTLHRLRGRALEILECLIHRNIYAIVHGSISRGDIHENSDIDIFIPYPISYPLIIEALYTCGLSVYETRIIQATPKYIPKVYIVMDPLEKEVVSFPLGPLSRSEREFYKWGGELSHKELCSDQRVPGVNKDLLLILPVENGHVEIPVIGNEKYVAKTVGIDISTVEERIRVLSTRKEKGRTGLFLEIAVPGEADLPEVVKKIADKNPYFRKRIGVL
ncbi:MAG: nucleotidyltransferase domain-containing protein [Desulfurococcales archaeon]|nr:nucleotidyltransferase domain-containing protein [Desulfurococcales archaeon]